MRIIGVLLILVGIIAMVASTVGFGDIGLAFLFIGLVSILSGIGFMLIPKKKKMRKQQHQRTEE